MKNSIKKLTRAQSLDLDVADSLELMAYNVERKRTYPEAEDIAARLRLAATWIKLVTTRPATPKQVAYAQKLSGEAIADLADLEGVKL